jgi:hypothetical protein
MDWARRIKALDDIEGACSLSFGEDHLKHKDDRESESSSLFVCDSILQPTFGS